MKSATISLVLGFILGLGINCIAVKAMPTKPHENYDACIEAYESCKDDLEEALEHIDELNAYCSERR